jgi:hypothetical protein
MAEVDHEAHNKTGKASVFHPLLAVKPLKPFKMTYL